ncbi:MAG: bifunctional oligoribonuclease/PAP phosphatase NrnA [Planctomycetota bacterium]
MTVPTEREFRRDAGLTLLLNAVRGRCSALIQTHNNPDPDALGSAVGMRELYRRYLNTEARIVFGGIVGRAENRAMLRLLKIEIVPANKVDYASCDLLTIVDAQPGHGHAPLPDGRVPEVVIDHHPLRAGEEPKGALYWDVGRVYGATSTIVAQFFLRNRVPLSTTVATALLYGIKSDTHNLGADATPADVEAYRELLLYSDNSVLSRVQSARVPPPYFAVFRRAIANALVYDFACVSHLGKIDNPDMVPEMADFLLRCENLSWTMVTGIFKKTLHLSIRSSDRNAHAGEVARRAVGVMGYAGGHGRMAGGQVPLGKADKKTRLAVTTAVTELFLEAVKAKRTLSHSLVGGALPDETDTSAELP